jgi:hypothetical protein
MLIKSEHTLDKTPPVRRTHLRGVQRRRVKDIAVRLIGDAMRGECALPEFVAALAMIVGSVAGGLRVEARDEFYRRFLAAAGSAEAGCDRAIWAGRKRH